MIYFSTANCSQKIQESEIREWWTNSRKYGILYVMIICPNYKELK